MGTEMVDGDGDGDGIDRGRDGSNAGGQNSSTRAEAESHVRGSVEVSLPPCKVQGRLEGWERGRGSVRTKRASQDFG